MLSINTNKSSLIAQNSMKSSTDKLNQAIERMTTGAKINHAKDNAANYSIATNMTTKINAYQVAEDNCAMGLDLISSASSTLDLISEHLTRIRDLAVQASNGTYGNNSLNAVQAEVNARLEEIKRISNNSNYNGLSLSGKSLVEELGENGLFKNNIKITKDNLPEGYTAVTTANELKTALANNENIVLLNDINMNGFSWEASESLPYSGILDGNGYTIKNLDCSYTESGEGACGGLIGLALDGTVIKNLKLTNVKNDGHYSPSATLCLSIAPDANVVIDNCSVEITSTSNYYSHGGGYVGIIEEGANLTITNSLVEYGEFIERGGPDNRYEIYQYSLNIKQAGGFVGINNGTLNIQNCAVGTNGVEGSPESKKFTAGGIVAINNGKVDISNTVITGDAHYYAGCFIGINNGENSITTSFVPTDNNYATSSGSIYPATATNMELNKMIADKIDGKFIQETKENCIIDLQVGINSASQISFSIDPIDISAITGIDLTDKYTLQSIDNFLATINAQQTKLGAVQNRLESALDEISTQYDNLVSSRSTIQDADIAEVSSEYIKMQILQQASATLMATANQSPSIALQLL